MDRQRSLPPVVAGIASWIRLEFDSQQQALDVGRLRDCLSQKRKARCRDALAQNPRESGHRSGEQHNLAADMSLPK